MDLSFEHDRWISIADHPLPMAIREIFSSRKSGELTARRRGTERMLFFREGDLVEARSNLWEDRIGEKLVADGLLNRDQQEKVVQLLEQTKDRIGRIIIQLGYLDKREMFRALLSQKKGIALAIFGITEGEWRFRDAPEKTADVPPVRISTVEVIRSGVGRISQWALFIERFQDCVLTMSADSETIRSVLDATEIEFIQQIAKFPNQSPRLLQESLRYPEVEFWRLIMMLYVMGIIGLESAGLENKLRKSLLDYFSRVQAGSMNYYECLGIDENACSETIREAYMNLIRKFHPDRIAVFGEDDLKETANRVVAEINRAYSVLSSDEKRREYDRAVRHQAPMVSGQRNTRQRARILYRKARTLAARGMHRETVALMEQALKLHPDKPAYLLLLGISQGELEYCEKSAETTLKRVADLEPWNPDAHFHLARLYLRAGMPKIARSSLEKAVFIDEQHRASRRLLASLENQHSAKKRLFGWRGLFGRKYRDT